MSFDADMAFAAFIPWPLAAGILAFSPRLQGVEHWKKFYAESKKYGRVGTVMHPPIDPASPIPEHCDPKKAQKAKEREEAEAKARVDAAADKEKAHEEL